MRGGRDIFIATRRWGHSTSSLEAMAALGVVQEKLLAGKLPGRQQRKPRSELFPPHPQNPASCSEWLRLTAGEGKVSPRIVGSSTVGGALGGSLSHRAWSEFPAVAKAGDGCVHLQRRSKLSTSGGSESSIPVTIGASRIKTLSNRAIPGGKGGNQRLI